MTLLKLLDLQFFLLYRRTYLFFIKRFKAIFTLISSRDRVEWKLFPNALMQFVYHILHRAHFCSKWATCMVGHAFCTPIPSHTNFFLSILPCIFHLSIYLTIDINLAIYLIKSIVSVWGTDSEFRAVIIAVLWVHLSIYLSDYVCLTTSDFNVLLIYISILACVNHFAHLVSVTFIISA